jgi:DNA-directed RNA polymerase sigma subunit (sigma70/sigma32)
MTLEAIGKKYNITRERVRQIENHAVATIRKSKEYQKEKKLLMNSKPLFTISVVLLLKKIF